jgi:hypothetical protein
MTIFHIRDRLANLCGKIPPANQPCNPLPTTTSPIVHSSKALAQAMPEIIFKRYPPLIPAQKPKTTAAPPQKTAPAELPHDILLNILNHVQDKPTLKALSLVKPLRQEVLALNARECTLDNLLHLKNAKELSQFVQNLHIDPELDCSHLASIRDWELPSLKQLTIGNSPTRTRQDAQITHQNRLLSQLFATHPHLSKISTLTLNDGLAFMDDFSNLHVCTGLSTIQFGSSNAKISKMQLEQLAALPALETLSFEGTGSVNQHNCLALPLLPHVKSLELSGAFVFNINIFNPIAQMPELEVFSFHDAHQNEGVEALKTLMTHSPKLKRIQCKRFWISNQNIQELKKFAKERDIELDIQQSRNYVPPNPVN